MNKNNLVLIGFMGSGKTSVGRFFAARHKMTQIDTDQYIEEWQNKRIKDIFAEEGETAFRDLETQALRRLKEAEEGIVLSVGGGLPMKEENRPLLKDFGTVVYLKAGVDTLVERLSRDTSRPLLQGGDLRDKITTLMAAREATYMEVADVVIETDHKSFGRIEKEILQAIKERA